MIFGESIILYPINYLHFVIIFFVLNLFEGLKLFGNFDRYFPRSFLIGLDFLLHFWSFVIQ